MSWRTLCYLAAFALVLTMTIRGLLQDPNPISQAESMRQASQSWATARQALPRTVPLYRPTWLPAAFHTASVSYESVLVSDQPVLYLAVYYDLGGPNRSFTIRIDNTSVAAEPNLMQDTHPDWTIPVQVRGRAGHLLVQQGDERWAFVWQAGQWRYSVQAWGVSLDDMLRLVAGLEAF
jgi:hypothetical protein